ncbi:MAG: M20/M25/M40 family metallo-hydrolase, partial [Candidatus Thorarchaeota archaeon]|nr:M20/M25/M40 family metallo-hydrolase [Candidatus Thorarchaeota archaeon]
MDSLKTLLHPQQTSETKISRFKRRIKVLGIHLTPEEELVITAYEHARVLSVDIGPRPSGSENSKRTAEYLLSEFKSIGVAKAYIDEFRMRPAFWSGTASFALVFSFVIMLTMRDLSILALTLAALLPVLTILEIDQGREVMMKILPSSIGRNVIGIESPTNEMKNRVIICAHHDSKTQAIPIGFRGVMLLFVLVGMIYLFIASLIKMLADFVFTQLSFLTEYLILGSVVATGYYGIYAILNYVTSIIEESPGAEDNAIAVGIILELAKKLKDTRLEHTEMWYLFTDAEEIAMKGANVFARQYKHDLEYAYVINIEGCGTDAPLAYSVKQQSIMSKPTSQTLIDILVNAASEKGESITPITFPATTDGYQFARNGFEVVTIWRYDEDEKSVAHTPRDTIDRMDINAINKTMECVESVLRIIDGRESPAPNS